MLIQLGEPMDGYGGRLSSGCFHLEACPRELKVMRAARRSGPRLESTGTRIRQGLFEDKKLSKEAETPRTPELVSCDRAEHRSPASKSSINALARIRCVRYGIEYVDDELVEHVEKLTLIAPDVQVRARRVSKSQDSNAVSDWRRDLGPGTMRKSGRDEKVSVAIGVDSDPGA